MKVVGFVGSPRRDGNTDVLVRKILQGAASQGAQTKVFYLNEMDFKGCQGGAARANRKGESAVWMMK